MERGFEWEDAEKSLTWLPYPIQKCIIRQIRATTTGAEVRVTPPPPPFHPVHRRPVRTLNAFGWRERVLMRPKVDKDVSASIINSGVWANLKYCPPSPIYATLSFCSVLLFSLLRRHTHNRGPRSSDVFCFVRYCASR